MLAIAKQKLRDAASGRRRTFERFWSGNANVCGRSSRSTKGKSFEQLTLDFDEEEKRQLEDDIR